MKPKWFKPRGYKHFDAPVGPEWASAITPEMVIEHSWSPLIHWVKTTLRYKPIDKKTVAKDRDIMFASHRDACILAKYSAEIVSRLDAWYELQGLNENVIAYRSLGLSNYHFAAIAQAFVRSHDPVAVMCFDVTGFFDNLDHRLLKRRLNWLLSTAELPTDWYRIFRHVTAHRSIKRGDLKAHAIFGPRMNKRGAMPPVGKIAEIMAAGVAVHSNPNRFGIPQGTPISASLSNLYLCEFDAALAAAAAARGALYQRYSDDILIACSPEFAEELAEMVVQLLNADLLKVKDEKTERVTLTGAERNQFQYLGYRLGLNEAEIRPGSLSKQWRSARRAIRKAIKRAVLHADAGEKHKILTRKLRGKLTHVGVRNFISYANRSADELQSTLIKRQVKRLHKFSIEGLANVKELKK